MGAVALAVTGVATLGAAGRWALAYEQVAGQPAVLLDEVVGADTGPACAPDDRYVDEPPRGLRADVLAAWNRLRTAAARQGIHLCLNDGKRSARQQQQEFDDAVRRFGTAELASRYVLPPEKSMHVKGIAVDVQPYASAQWVQTHGRTAGWCRRYDNEYWHFEYDRRYISEGCPELLPSATAS